MKLRKKIVSLTYYTSVVEFVVFVEFIVFRESFGKKAIFSEHLSPSLGCSVA
jgi:hypothetical protein